MATDAPEASRAVALNRVNSGALSIQPELALNEPELSRRDQPPMSDAGVVRLTNHELADHDRSSGELTPFSERGSTVLFEDIAAVEVAVVVVVVD